VEQPSFDNLRLLVRTTDRNLIKSAARSLSAGVVPAVSVDSDAAPKFSEMPPPNYRARLIREPLNHGLDPAKLAQVVCDVAPTD
jgi:hypothetical protein